LTAARAGDPSEILRIGPKRRWTAFVALCAPGFTVLLVGACIDIAGRSHLSVPVKILFIAGFVTFFVPVLVVPSWLSLWHVARGIPVVTIDDRGIVWGRDRTRDLTADWSDIDRIRGVPYRSRGYSDRLLWVETGSVDRTRALGRWKRFQLRLTNWIYGAPLVIPTTILQIEFDELVAAIRARYRGPVDLSRLD
jgi:hypothetical protein